MINESLKQEILSFSLESGKLNPHISQLSWKFSEDLKNFLKENELSPKQLFYIAKNNLTEIPVCKVCGGKIKEFERGIVFCSKKCSTNYKETQEKRKTTCLEKYGVYNALQSESIKEKMKQTNLKRYGAKYIMSLEEFRDKAAKTVKEKYGTQFAGQSDIIKEKIKNTNLEKYGVKCPFNLEYVKDKVKEKVKSEESKNKRKKTCLERYGVESSLNINKEEKLLKREKTSRFKYYPVFLELLKSKNIEYLGDREEFTNSNRLNKFKCLLCGKEWEQYHHKGSQDIHCPECSQKPFSKKEKDLLDYIKSIYSGTIIENDKTILDGKELDIYIPEKNLAFEFDGTYWHSTRIRDKYYHQEKTLKCREKGIRLIHIFEYEWDNNRDKIEKFIKGSLEIFDKTIYARNCEVRKIESEEYLKFLNFNHLQGEVKSPIRYGLFFENELVSVIGFGKSRFKKEETELHRYCVKLGYKVIGGFSKLIKHSGVNDFISYVDLNHFDGKGYERLGFEELEITKPNYVWVKSSKVLSRNQTQKHKLKELLNEEFLENLSEVENMEKSGWNQIFGSGNLKMKFSSNKPYLS